VYIEKGKVTAAAAEGTARVSPFTSNTRPLPVRLLMAPPILYATGPR
jgi:hypothetical protein